MNLSGMEKVRCVAFRRGSKQVSEDIVISKVLT